MDILHKHIQRKQLLATVLVEEVVEGVEVMSEPLADHVDGETSSAEFLSRLDHHADVITRATQALVSAQYGQLHVH